MSNVTSGPRKYLGDFEVLRELGRGGMGVVFEARQVSLNRKVALKVLAGSLGLTSKAVIRFKREAEAAAKLHHTNIVPIYSTGEHEGTHYYAMELIDGPGLDQVLARMCEDQKHPPGAAVAAADSSTAAPEAVATTAEPPGIRPGPCKRSAMKPRKPKPATVSVRLHHRPRHPACKAVAAISTRWPS